MLSLYPSQGLPNCPAMRGMELVQYRANWSLQPRKLSFSKPRVYSVRPVVSCPRLSTPAESRQVRFCTLLISTRLEPASAPGSMRMVALLEGRRLSWSRPCSISRNCSTEPLTPGKMVRNCLGCMVEAASGPTLSTRPSIILMTSTPRLRSCGPRTAREVT